MGCLEGSVVPVPYMERTVSKLSANLFRFMPSSTSPTHSQNLTNFNKSVAFHKIARSFCNCRSFSAVQCVSKMVRFVVMPTGMWELLA
jgi:hypothetical protein